MKRSTRIGRRTAVIAGAAGLAVAGAVGIGATAAVADGGPATSASAAPSGAPTGAPVPPAAGKGAPAPQKHAPHIGGEVLSIDGSTVTVKDPEGFTRTIVLASDATVTKDGKSSSVSAITKGEHIEATGSVDANGTTLDATAVTIGMPTPPKGAPAGPAQGGPKGTPPTPPTAS